jgi:hypothetical protein
MMSVENRVETQDRILVLVPLCKKQQTRISVARKCLLEKCQLIVVALGTKLGQSLLPGSRETTGVS